MQPPQAISMLGSSPISPSSPRHASISSKSALSLQLRSSLSEGTKLFFAGHSSMHMPFPSTSTGTHRGGSTLPSLPLETPHKRPL
eukprot:CAMPEP_0185821812 /NCGR_PEP_ID=MMETSP1322-20130828/25768_1 /TAXON_ID=265543 /ORGANISM="Minutocellus polymorphus, Strain RCC2270" /LENGTH=84 /DNA_ID=CAMNT_0028519217 /DNA_START=11 /DNA_END=265 /DNA_ORIENTATION=+